MKRKLNILFVVTGILVFMFMFLKNPFEDKHDASYIPFYPSLKYDDVAAVEIENFVYGTKLVKQEDGGWTISPLKTKLRKKVEQKDNSLENNIDELITYPADEKKVERLINKLVDLERNEPVSVNAENHGVYEISDLSMNVKLKDEKQKILAHLFIGKSGPTPYMTYIKDASSDDVYLVSEILRGLVDQALEGWKKKPEEEKTPPGP